jgi:hypothetical protein
VSGRPGEEKKAVSLPWKTAARLLLLHEATKLTGERAKGPHFPSSSPPYSRAELTKAGGRRKKREKRCCRKIDHIIPRTEMVGKFFKELKVLVSPSLSPLLPPLPSLFPPGEEKKVDEERERAKDGGRDAVAPVLDKTAG